MLRILLPLLLCLSLVASATGSVWAATAMTMPAMTMAMDADHACCHDEAGSSATEATSACADGKHCDCMQHCNMLPSQAMARLSGVPQTTRPSPPAQARDDAAPARLNRPPIA